jgi:hypothetical protein
VRALWVSKLIAAEKALTSNCGHANVGLGAWPN